MRGLAATIGLGTALIACSLLGAAPARAEECPLPVAAECFGLHDLDIVFTGKNGEDLSQAGLPKGEVLSQAGKHPFELTVSFRVNGTENEKGGEEPFAPVRDVLFTFMPGFAGAPTAVPTCSTATSSPPASTKPETSSPAAPTAPRSGSSPTIWPQERGAKPPSTRPFT